jgi:hypothetical protein
MSNTFGWHLLTNSKLRSLSPPRQLESLALAYLESAETLCDLIAKSPTHATYEKGTVVLYLAAHAIELFLKGAILRKAPNERFAHDLEHIHNRYRALFPAQRFALTGLPFANEYPGLSKQEIAELKREQPDPSEIYRYPLDKSGEPWDAALAFEAGSYLKVLSTLRADFQRILEAHEV